MTTCTTMSLATTHAVQPLEWWADADLDGVRAWAEAACSAWVRDWMGGAPKVEISAVRAHERLPANRQAWIALGTRDERSAWVDARPDDVEGVLHALFPTEQGHIAPVSAQGIAYAVAAKAHCALVEMLRPRFDLDAADCEAEPDVALFKPWSGSVLISAALQGRSVIAVLLNRATVRCVLARDGLPKKGPCEPQPARAALDPLTQALAGRRLLLRVGLSSCELDIGSLESLRVGDIVPLPHLLDTPLAVSTVEGVQVCAGFLGCQDGVKAIELAREVSIDHDSELSQHTQTQV